MYSYDTQGMRIEYIIGMESHNHDLPRLFMFTPHNNLIKYYKIDFQTNQGDDFTPIDIKFFKDDQCQQNKGNNNTYFNLLVIKSSQKYTENAKSKY
jgi:hypothetical protein